MVKSASAGAADPDLAAVDHPVVAVALGAGGHAGRIAAGAGLGDADGRDGLAAHIGLQVGLALASFTVAISMRRFGQSGGRV